ncbi:MAG: hypothetical protein ACD_72C00534G0007 [uncultured bacterium]|nr:MAG: hypothetical protein ACD_72C00534G0007 [uncultured bacterium]
MALEISTLKSKLKPAYYILEILSIVGFFICSYVLLIKLPENLFGPMDFLGISFITMLGVVIGYYVFYYYTQKYFPKDITKATKLILLMVYNFILSIIFFWKSSFIYIFFYYAYVEVVTTAFFIAIFLFFTGLRYEKVAGKISLHSRVKLSFSKTNYWWPISIFFGLGFLTLSVFLFNFTIKIAIFEKTSWAYWYALAGIIIMQFVAIYRKMMNFFTIALDNEAGRV